MSLFPSGRLHNWTAPVLACAAFFAAGWTAQAQFKVTGPAPYSNAVARQKVKALLEKVDSNNRQQTLDTLSGWLTWYRDIIDDEIVAAWKKETRANLPDVVKPLADARIAAAVIDFSWREQRESAFLPAYAPMFEDMMIRFPDSSQPMMSDLVRSAAAGAPLDLTEPEAETVCRILLDMPDIGVWRKQATQILPFYRQAAQRLLAQDERGADQDRKDRADFWLYDPRSSIRESPAAPTTVAGANGRRRMVPSGDPPALIGADPDPSPQTRPSRSSPSRPTLLQQPAPEPQAYNGPRSGTLNCRGEAVPQNGEYVFRNLPLGDMQLVLDTKIWEARLAPGDGQTQKLILRNKASGAQKRCTVHWTLSQ